MKATHVLALVLAISSLLTGAASAQLDGSAINHNNFAHKYYVRSSGNDSHDGKSPANAFKTMTKAALVAGPSTIIYVGAGTYEDAAVVYFTNTATAAAPCFLFADTTGQYTGDAGAVVVQCPINQTAWTWYINNASGYGVVGFKFAENPSTHIYNQAVGGTADTASGGYRPLGLAIWGTSQSDFLVSNCTFEGCQEQFQGNGANTLMLNCVFNKTRYRNLYVSYCANLTLRGCTLGKNDLPDSGKIYGYLFPFYSNQSQMAVDSCTFDFSGSGRTSDGFAYGAYLDGASDGSTTATATFTTCTFKNCPYLAVQGSWLKSLVLTNCTATDCRYGFYALGEAATIDRCTVTLTSSSPFYKTGTYGVYLSNPLNKNMAITNTTIQGYYEGLYLDTDNPSLGNLTITGTGRDYYQKDASGHWQPNSSYYPSIGIYLRQYTTSFTYNGVQYTSGGCHNLTLSAAQNLSLTNLSHLIYCDGPASITCQGLTLQGALYGVIANSGCNLTLSGCTLTDNWWSGVSGSDAGDLTLTACTVTSNGAFPYYWDNSQNGWGYGWAVNWSAHKTDQSDQGNGYAGYWNGMPGPQKLTLTGNSFLNNGNGLQLSSFAAANMNLSANVVNSGLYKDASGNWRNMGYGVAFQNGDCQLSNDQQFAITNSYYGLTHSWGSLAISGCSLATNFNGLTVSRNHNFQATNCSFSNNFGWGCYSDTCQQANVTGCTLASNGSGGYYDNNSTQIKLTNTTANLNTTYGVYLGGYWPAPVGAISLKNVTANGNGAYGVYVWEPASLSADGVTANSNASWNFMCYTNYAKYIYDYYQASYSSYFPTGRPKTTPAIAISNSTFSHSQGSGGMYLYSYDGAGANDTPWTRSDLQFFNLNKIVCDDNWWYGVYLENATIIPSGGAAANLNLEVSNTYYGIVFNRASVTLNGMIGMNPHDNAYGLNVWRGNATLANCTVGTNAWGLYCYGYYDPAQVTAANPAPSYGRFSLDGCTFNGSGVTLDYPTSLSVTNTSIQNARDVVTLSRTGSAPLTCRGYGLSTWRDRIPCTPCQYKNLTVNNCYQGIINNGYSDANVVLDTVTSTNNDYHGAGIYHTSYSLTNCKFNKNGLKQYTAADYGGAYTGKYVAYYGFDSSCNTYDFTTGQWNPLATPTTVQNCDFSGNGGYAFTHYYSPLTMTNCTIDSNGYGVYTYDADAAFANVTASNNYRRDYTNNGWIGIIAYSNVRPHTWTFTNCTANGNIGNGIEAYGPCLPNMEQSTVVVDSCTANNNNYGNGIMTQWLASATIKNCTATGNDNGWGIYTALTDATITGCNVSNNGKTPGSGGGLYAYGGYYYGDPGTWQHSYSAKVTDWNWDAANNTYLGIDKTNANKITITGCTASGNTHSGIYAYYGDVAISNTQASGNYYYGVYTGSGRANAALSSAVTDSTLSNNGSIGIYHYGSSALFKNLTIDAGGGGVGVYTYGNWWTQAPFTTTVQNTNISNTQSHGFQGGLQTVVLQNSTINHCGYNKDGTANWGGSYFSTGNLQAYDCNFTNNTAYGIETYYSPSITLERNTIQKNRYWGILSYQNDAALLRNNVVVQNGNGVYIRDRKNGADVWNNTVADNTSYGGIYLLEGTARVHNNLVYANNQYGMAAEANTTFVHTHNLVFGQVGGWDFYQPGVAANNVESLRHATEVKKHARFANRASGDYRLAKGSPAINVGLTDLAWAPTDKLGVARPTYGATDIGAFEYPDKNGSIRTTVFREQK